MSISFETREDAERVPFHPENNPCVKGTRIVFTNKGVFAARPGDTEVYVTLEDCTDGNSGVVPVEQIPIAKARDN